MLSYIYFWFTINFFDQKFQMRLYNTFNQYFSLLYLFLFIINCFGQEHQHDHSTNSIEPNEILENDLPYLLPSLLSSQEDDQRSITNKIEIKTPQTCWHLPKQIEPSFGLVENQILRFINLVCLLIFA
jgi:hypothetical protein